MQFEEKQVLDATLQSMINDLTKIKKALKKVKTSDQNTNADKFVSEECIKVWNSVAGLKRRIDFYFK